MTLKNDPSNHAAMPMRSPIGKAKGLGSAKSGVTHWLGIRLTALALLPLGVWFVISAFSFTQMDAVTAMLWLKTPVHALMMLLFIGVSLHHSANGLQEVIEDYIHAPLGKWMLTIISKFMHVALAAGAALAIILVFLKA